MSRVPQCLLLHNFVKNKGECPVSKQLLEGGKQINLRVFYYFIFRTSSSQSPGISPTALSNVFAIGECLVRYSKQFSNGWKFSWTCRHVRACLCPGPGITFSKGACVHGCALVLELHFLRARGKCAVQEYCSVMRVCITIQCRI